MLIDKLKKIDIILGSQSPRRKELLRSMGVNFTVEVREVDEVINQKLQPEDIAKEIALLKLSAFTSDEAYYQKLVLTSDTIVVSAGGLALGKPSDANDAYEVIKSLSGQSHLVFTAVAIAYQGDVHTFAEATEVKFADLDDDEINYYIDQFKPYDKAGAYGIQEWIGRIGLEKINGSFENVMGLPTQRLYRELKAIVK